MDSFSATPPDWINSAIHAHAFCCPKCQRSASTAQQAWINRRSPVITEEYKRKWQEFYRCSCGESWWAWNGDRPLAPERPAKE